MHVADSASMKTEQDVNEATAALKGMLGLGTAPATASNRTTVPPVATVVPAETETSSSAKEEPKKKKRSNRGKKKQQQEQGNATTRAVPADQQQSKRPTSKSRQQQQQQQQQQQLSDNKTKDSGGPAVPKKKKNTKPQNKNKGGGAESENFAWSAFQASPDPSTLPIPAFSPVVHERDVVEINPHDMPEAADMAKAPIPSSSSPAPVDSSETEKVAFAVKTGVDETKSSRTDLSEKEAVEVPVEDKTASAVEEEPPVSATGVNLAAAVASGKPDASPQTDPARSPSQYSQPFPLQQHHVGPPPMYNMPPPHHPQHQQQHSNMYHPPPHPHQLHPHHGGYPQQQHHTLPPHMAAAYQPPPGYVTINVQVPANLMPGRQMVVASPVTGMPVQVVVPDQVPPGAIIPVHVPAPMHMMPPPHHHLQHPLHSMTSPPHHFSSNNPENYPSGANSTDNKSNYHNR